MKTTLALIFFLSLQVVSFNIFAQAISPDSLRYSIQKGSWSAQFEIGSFINTGAFESYLISFKHHFSVKSSVRLGVGLNNSKNSGDDIFMGGDTSITYPSVSKNLTINVIADFLFYANPKSIVKIFIGVGPVYRYRKQEYTTNDIYFTQYGPDINANHHSSESWSAGINAVFGAEWFPFKSISLIAEYNSNILWGNTKTNSDYVHSDPFSSSAEQKYSSEYTTQEIDLNIIKLGISAYF
jgi:hypothetical protein